MVKLKKDLLCKNSIIYNLTALSYSIKKDWLAVITTVRVLFATRLVLTINTIEEKSIYRRTTTKPVLLDKRCEGICGQIV
jgi:hypothetical protein